MKTIEHDSPASLDFLLKIKADFIGALAHPARLRLIEALKRGPRTVGELAAEAQLAQPATSKHLGLLRQAGILEARPEGKTVRYRITDPALFRALGAVNALLEARLRRSQQALKALGRHPA